MDIPVDAPPLPDGIGDCGKAVIEQDHIRRILGNIRAAATHCHADIGGLERRSVIDPVPRHRGNLARTLQ